MTNASPLRDNWYRLDVEPGFDLDQSGIIERRVEGHGVDVSRAASIRGRIDDFAGNLRDMLAGEDYLNRTVRDFRDIHHAILTAYQQQTPTSMTVLETCAPAVLERWLERRRAEERAGGPKVLTNQ